MSVRVMKNKPGWYEIDFYPNGRQKDPETGKVKRIIRQVQGRANAIELELTYRRQASTFATPTPFIRDIAVKRAAWYEINKSHSTMMDFEWRWSRLEPHFGNLQFHLLTSQHIEDYKIARLNQNITKRTINHELTYLSSMWKWAAKKNNYCAAPHFQIDKFDGVKASLMETLLKVDIPTPEEIRRILFQVHPRARVLAMLMYYCGLRRNEALQIKKANINLITGFMHVIGKGGKHRLVPIPDNDELKNELTRALNHDNKTEYLVVSPWTGAPFLTIKGGLKAAALRAGYSGKVWQHLLRHTYATHGAQAGVDARTMQLNLGHSNLSTTEIYTHVAALHQKQETSKFSQYVSLNTTVETFDPGKAKRKQRV